MGYFANQGKHDPEAEAFPVIVAPRVIAKIYKVSEHKHFENSVRLDMRIISPGEFFNKTLNDGVPFNASDNFAWKYIAARKAIGKPYVVGEPNEIDLEELFLNKVVVLELTSAKDSKGVPRQRVKYLLMTNADVAIMNAAPDETPDAKPNKTEVEVTTKEGSKVVPTIDVTEDDLPF